jgi:class 3 adenylate cyclase/tetratricopeptide (TPR) repeat protein/ABC-type dipeptide/oligopeptide/nickel transport system ATPase subunit
MIPRTLYAMECVSCQTDVDDDASFCSNCGHEMARRFDERRVVTVLFADIVGFTGLSEARDPEQVKILVDRCFALLADDVTAFGGRVDKVVGDAIVALFGAPIAHEDDAERSVRAALRMQETVQRFDADTGVGIRVRIGVNTGEVLVGAISAGDDYTAMGDVVNTASRLQTAADPGAVLVGAATYDATAEVIHYRSLGQLHARGREEPVTAYQAIEPVGRPGERRAAPTLPLLGRDPELAMLRAAVSAAYRRSRAQLVVVAGESGVGKTRLAAELASTARRDHGALVLHGRCLPYGEANVWWPVAEAIRNALGVDVDSSPDEVTRLVAEGVANAFGPAADETNVARTTEGLRHLLGYDTELSRLDAERAADEGTRAARALVHALSMRSPVLVWISDLDWADEAVLRLLDDLLDRIGRGRLVVMVTGRAEMFQRWAPAPGRFNEVTLSLEPLDNAAAELLARELLPDATAEMQAQLAERSGGNPLFLEEMARMVDHAGGEVGPLPANVRSVISARLDALDDASRYLIEDASVLGLRGEWGALQRMAEFQRDESDITDALRGLERIDLLDVDGRMWSFRSNLVRDVVYSRLTKTDRAWRHAGIATWIETNEHMGTSELIAYHYRRAAAMAAELGGVEGMPDDVHEKAISWTLAAAAETSGANATERTDHLLGDALELMDDQDERKATVLLDRAQTAISRIDTTAARRDVVAAQQLLITHSTPELALREALLRSEIEQWSGEQEVALAIAEEALVAARALNDPIREADAQRRVGLVRLFQGEHELAEASITEAYEAYAAADDRSGMAWARQNLAWIAYVSGRMGEAERRLLQAVEAFETLGDLSGTAWSRGLLAYVRIHAGRFAEAEELAKRTLAEARDRGDRWAQGMMHVALATVALWTGRVDEAIRRSQKAGKVFPDGSDPLGPTQAIAIEGRSLVRSGRIAEGLRLLAGALDSAPEQPTNQILETSLAAAAATVGDLSVGRRIFHEVRGFDPDRLGESDLAVATALIQLQLGNVDAASRLLAVMPENTDEGSSWGWAVLALIAAAIDKDVDGYVAIVEESQRSTYSDQVIARCATACAAARAGDETGARVALDRAYEAVPLGGDRIHPTIVALAEAVCLTTLETDDAPTAEVRAVKTASAIGLDTLGWRTAFAVACGQQD